MTTPLPQAPEATLRRFRADVVRGLRARPKYLPCKYFYDRIGSELFDEITQLDEYYLTRTEQAIMAQHVAAMAQLIGSRCMLIEYGSGSSIKTRLLLDHLDDPVAYVPIDLSGAPLRRSAEALAAEYPSLEVLPLCADFTQPFTVPAPQRPASRRVVYFPGSTIGNFAPAEVIALLRHTARRSDALLLGADVRKDPKVIEAAYNDGRGVTAAFNRNLLVRINRELGADFVPERFAHRAFFNDAEGRIEMHLVSECDQTASVGKEVFHFAASESIHTENSYKYRLAELEDLAQRAGFATTHVWMDDAQYFSVLYLVKKECAASGLARPSRDAD